MKDNETITSLLVMHLDATISDSTATIHDNDDMMHLHYQSMMFQLQMKVIHLQI